LYSSDEFVLESEPTISDRRNTSTLGFFVNVMLPLVDLFRNKKVEFDYSLPLVKLFYASLKLQEIGDSNFPFAIKKIGTSIII